MPDYQKFADTLKNKGISATVSEPLSSHTTFKIGGPASLFITVMSEAELKTILEILTENNIKYFMLGNGSNLLVSDDGFDGAIITLSGDFNEISLIDKTRVYCGAGAKLSSLCNFALENGLSGLEFAFGIPGSVGGAVFMNAGAYGGEMKDVIASVNHITTDNFLSGTFNADELDLEYRHSIYSENGYIITGVTLNLKKGNKEDILSAMKDFLERRKSKQPLEYPSAGSVFKRPTGYFAGALIEECQLKGYTIGGAQVSEKHAGFIINRGNATANDVKSLVRHIQKTVKEEKGVELECEIKTLEF